MTDISKVCIVKFLGNRFWKWMTPEIYYVIGAAIFCSVMWKVAVDYGIMWFVGAWYLSTALITVIGILRGGDVGGVSLSMLGANVVPLMLLLVIDETSLRVLILSLVALAPIALGMCVVAVDHIWDVYRAAVEYCTPKDGR